MNNSSQKPETDEKLWETDDVMAFTGWGRTYISRLCTNGALPHIKGKPHKFVPSEVKNAIRQMQIGGRFGKKGEATTMKATVTSCPFTATANLADISAQGTAEIEKQTEPLIKSIKEAHPEISEQIDRLDDLYLQALTGSQNSTIRHLICQVCNARTVCTPQDQEPQC